MRQPTTGDETSSTLKSTQNKSSTNRNSIFNPAIIKQQQANSGLSKSITSPVGQNIPTAFGNQNSGSLESSNNTLGGMSSKFAKN